MSKWHGGKGDKARPIQDRKQFESNWDRIFGNKNERVNNEQTNNKQTKMDGDTPVSDGGSDAIAESGNL